MPPKSPQDPDHALMARIGRGDAEAFASLYDRYGAAVMRFLHRLTRDASLSEDLTQETFLSAWTAAARYRPTGRVSTWLFQIAKRRWWKRSARDRNRRRREAAAARPTSAAGLGPSPLEAAARGEAVERLHGALAGLRPKLRLVFVLVRLEGLSYRDAAEVAGLRLGTVKSRMAAAEAWLRRELGDPPP